MRLFKDKKAQEDDTGQLKLILAVLVGLAFLIAVLTLLNSNFFKKVQSDDFSEQTCREDIRANAKLISASGSSFHKLPNCKPKEIKINPEKNEAKKELADALMFCEERWQFGTKELMPDIKGQEDDEYGIYCNPCAHITFTNSEPILGFFDFLLTEKPDGYKNNYVDLLRPYESKESSINMNTQSFSNIPILTQSDYLVLFVYAKGETSIGKLKDNFNKNYARNFDKVATGSITGAAVVGTTAVIAGVLTGGIGTIVVLGVAGVAAGAGAGGLLTYFFSDAESPVWLSQVILIPNNAETFLNLGCQATYQQESKAIKDV